MQLGPKESSSCAWAWWLSFNTWAVHWLELAFKSVTLRAALRRSVSVCVCVCVFVCFEAVQNAPVKKASGRACRHAARSYSAQLPFSNSRGWPDGPCGAVDILLHDPEPAMGPSHLHMLMRRHNSSLLGNLRHGRKNQFSPCMLLRG